MLPYKTLRPLYEKTIVIVLKTLIKMEAFLRVVDVEKTPRPIYILPLKEIYDPYTCFHFDGSCKKPLRPLYMLPLFLNASTTPIHASTSTGAFSEM